VDKRERAFAEKAAAELRRAGLEGPVELDEDQFGLVAGDQQFFLANVYADWQRSSRLRRGGVLRQWVATLVERPSLPTAAEAARPNLLPRVRDREFVATMELRFQDAREGKGPAMSCVPLNDDLVVEIVYDHPRTVSSLGTEQLEAWGIELDEALRTARANLRERTEGTLRPLADGVYESWWDDAYDSARLLLTELITRLDVRGEPVAFIPHRDRLLVTGSEDAAGLERAAELAEPLLDDGRRLTGRPFILRDGAWQRFSVPESHEARPQLGRLEAITAALDYNDQKGALEERFAAAGEDVFVASVMLSEEADVLTSVCAWTEGVPTMLPRTELISLVRPATRETDDEITTVAWDDASAIVGDAMRAQNLFPERWRVDSFPDAEQLAQLRRVAGS